MKYAEFMPRLIEIYGTYQSPVLEKMTHAYIKERFQESDLDRIFNVIIIKVNPKFKTPPSPADFEELFFKKSDADFEIEANAAWENLQRYSGHYDAICSDVRVQLAIESTFGSWSGYGQRLEKYELLNHKNFVESFVKYSKNPVDATPSIMRGEGNFFTPPPPQLIGDKEKCNLLLSNNKKESLQIINNMVGGMKV